MPLNLTGPISLAGTTVGQSIQIELGGSGSTTISLNDTNVRTLAGVPSGAIVMPTNFYGKSNRAIINLTITTNTQNYNIYANRGGTYVAGGSDITLTINSGIVVGSATTSTFALDTGTGWATGDTVAIVNNGFIAGCSGAGGVGGGNPGAIFPPGENGNPGSTGGVSLVLRFNTTITNGSGFIYSGGGGGGGSSDGPDPERNPPRPGYPGGNGAGFATLAGATTTAGGPSFLNPLRPGSGVGGGGLGVVGAPGAPAPGGTGGGGGGGGAAGGFGVLRTVGTGGAGGAAGTAITRNGFTLTWVSGSGNVFGAQI
jgi:hypothetical protein